MKIAIFTLALILGLTTVNSQNFNDYKYVVVPETYGFLDTPNEYQLNALTKFLLKKNNFKTLMKSEKKPSDLKANGCLGLYANVEENSGVFVTRLVLLLENCNGEVVFRSKEGTSREKDYKMAHQEALREAFASLEDVDYQYDGNSITASPTTTAEVEGEVAVSTSNEDMEATAEDKQEYEEIEISAAEGTEMEEENENYFILDNAVYFLAESNAGFSFFQKGMAEPFASLIKSEGQESFIYNSITKQGLAYFDNEGNLVVEHFDRNKNEMIKTIYKVQD